MIYVKTLVICHHQSERLKGRFSQKTTNIEGRHGDLLLPLSKRNSISGLLAIKLSAVLVVETDYASSARCRSSRRSSNASRPTERRIRPSVIPCRARAAAS